MFELDLKQDVEIYSKEHFPPIMPCYLGETVRTPIIRSQKVPNLDPTILNYYQDAVWYNMSIAKPSKQSRTTNDKELIDRGIIPEYAIMPTKRNGIKLPDEVFTILQKNEIKVESEFYICTAPVTTKIMLLIPEKNMTVNSKTMEGKITRGEIESSKKEVVNVKVLEMKVWVNKTSLKDLSGKKPRYYISRNINNWLNEMTDLDTMNYTGDCEIQKPWYHFLYDERGNILLIRGEYNSDNSYNNLNPYQSNGLKNNLFGIRF